MNIIEYYVKHAFPTGFQSIRGAFIAWRDLISGNWDGYALLSSDDPYEECREWFWQLLGEDNVYPKEFLEDLMAIVERIDRNEEELIDWPPKSFNRGD